MILRLDARYPVVWRSPNSLQLGVDTPLLVLESVSLPTEHMIAAVGTGVTRSGLLMVGKAAGASEQEVLEFLDTVAPALEADVPSNPRTVVIVGSGRTADRLSRLLASAGFEVFIVTDPVTAEQKDCDFAVIVANFVVEPSLHGLWLRRDIPHLAVVLSGTTVEVGPIVEPGVGPCLYCLQSHATDADPAWPAIATQLWGRRSTADTELLACEAATVATRVIVGHFSGSVGLGPGTRLRIDVSTGEVSQNRFAPHPECGCFEPGKTNGSARADDSAQPESDSGSAAPRRDPAPVLVNGIGTTKA